MKVKNIQIIFMEVRELRIGNWVSHWGDSCMVKEIKHENTSFYLYCADTLNDLVNVGNVIDAFKPIPLTPEILEKAGFEKGIELTGSWTYYLNETEIRFNGEAILQVDCCDYGKPIKYIHQLQNLYFSLTGEELAIEL